MNRWLIFAQVQWHGLSVLPISIAAAAVALAAVLWLYPRQVRALDNPWRWLLPGLRATALVVLALSLLKPVISRSRLPDEAGAIAIVIDRSRSMGVIDFRHDDADLVRLADGLRLLPEGARPPIARRLPDAMHTMRAQIDATSRALGERQYADLAGHDIAAAEQRLIEAQQMLRSHIADCLAIADPTDDQTMRDRLTALADTAADPSQDQWLTTLNKQFDAALRAVNTHVARIDRGIYKTRPDVRAICDGLRDRSRLELATDALAGQTGLLRKIPGDTLLFGFTVSEDLQPLPLHNAGKPVDTLSIDPDGVRSRISGAVPRVLERLSGRPVDAVVLLSDGRQVGGEQRVVSSLFAGGVPVFTVLTAREQPPPDTAITRLRIPDTLFAGQEAVIRADIRLSGARQSTQTVRLHAAGQTHEQRIDLRGGQPQTVAFPIVIDDAGIHDIRIEVEPDAREASVENNSAMRRVKVPADRARVIALAGTATWDFQYLRNLLRRVGWIELTDAIVPPGAGAGVSPGEILDADVLILVDVAATSLNAAQRDAIHRLVTDRGGSVILIAGDAHLPGDYDDDVLLAALLPWRSGSEATWRQWPGEAAGFRPVPATTTAAAADLLRLNDDPDLAAAWTTLPSMFRILAMPELKPNARPLLIERDASLPLLTESRLGAGRVFFAGFNESWRWRFKSGDAQHARFWRQLVRHAAEAPYAVSNAQYAFDADALSIEPDQPLRLRAKRLADSDQPLRVRILRDNEQVASRLLEAVPDDPRRAQCLLDPLESGDYELQLVSGDDATQLTLPLKVESTLEPELLDLAPDPALLRRLAESSGGMLLSLDSLHQLAPRLRELTEQRPATVRQPLWDSPYLFGFILGCLSLEWAMRKRLGLT